MNIDPFAPGDSPQHPANWRPEQDVASAPVPDVADQLANIYQWQRDHLTRASESDVDIAPEELQERHERYDDYADEYLSEDEDYRQGGEFVSFPAMLRRAVFADLDEEGIAEWKELFEQHATEDERDPMWVEEVLPDLNELRQRATPPTTSEPVEPELPPVPKATALKEEWVEYARAVAKARGEKLTAKQADGMTVAALKAAYKPKDA